MLGSVRDLRVGGQPALATPVGLPEAPVQLLQLWAQRQVAGQVHAEGLQPLFQLHEGGPGVGGGGGRQEVGAWWLLALLGNPPPHPALSPSSRSPLLRVQVTAAHSNGEEARGAVWGAVAVQEASHVEAKIHGARQVVRVSIHSPDDLSRRGPAVTRRALGLGATRAGLRVGHTRPGTRLTTGMQAVVGSRSPQPPWPGAPAGFQPAAPERVGTGLEPAATHPWAYLAEDDPE